MPGPVQHVSPNSTQGSSRASSRKSLSMCVSVTGGFLLPIRQGSTAVPRGPSFSPAPADPLRPGALRSLSNKFLAAGRARNRLTGFRSSFSLCPERIRHLSSPGRSLSLSVRLWFLPVVSIHPRRVPPPIPPSLNRAYARSSFAACPSTPPQPSHIPRVASHRFLFRGDWASPPRFPRNSTRSHHPRDRPGQTPRRDAVLGAVGIVDGLDADQERVSHVNR